MNEFTKGDKVLIKHDHSIGECVVTDPHEVTAMTRVGGEPVGFYVRINTPKVKGAGYHAASLEKIS